MNDDARSSQRTVQLTTSGDSGQRMDDSSQQSTVSYGFGPVQIFSLLMAFLGVVALLLHFAGVIQIG